MGKRLVWQIALRYLRGKRGGNIVPILSRISMVAIAVGGGALIILFSVLNGFEGVVKDLYKAFYPDVKISPVHGKFFALDAAQYKSISGIEGVQQVSNVIEDNVFVASNDEQIVVTLKGVDNNYFKVNDITPYIIEGRDTLTTEGVPTAIVGLHIAAQLGTDVNNALSRMNVYYPNSKKQGFSMDLASSYQSLRMKPDGLFRIQDDFDARYIIAPLHLAQQLFLEEGKVSSVELKLHPGANAENVKKQLQKALGSNVKAETRYEQNRTLYMVMRTEKYAVFAILLLVLLIASFNMIGALSLLVLEKQKDVAILQAMGASARTLRNIFIAEGVLWSLTGGLAGIILAGIICFLQQQFGLVKLNGNFIIDAYPVAMEAGDFLLVAGTVILVGVLAAWYPATKAMRADAPGLKS